MRESLHQTSDSYCYFGSNRVDRIEDIYNNLSWMSPYLNRFKYINRGVALHFLSRLIQ
ncbi:hypothetical protein RINTHH_6190 [Richelia intracellularis HH01]|uniref:Uncharacterized protein n=1 Tax=Richelia intracellularis HH01 TaxID=1165094 RepID=M1WR76_9NOST|nr:hypothetical protein RINTHH_6190 [Richelia intracellularis HH01]